MWAYNVCIFTFIGVEAEHTGALLVSKVNLQLDFMAEGDEAVGAARGGLRGRDCGWHGAEHGHVLPTLGHVGKALIQVGGGRGAKVVFAVGV